jgi:fermentation-respiration switch protein FrsA (DUF1100 family)
VPAHDASVFPGGVEVTYRNRTDGTALAGTLTIPPGDGPFPAVVFVQGNGGEGPQIMSDWILSH